MLDHVDLDAVSRFVLVRGGMPAKCIRDKERVDKRRVGREQQMRAERQYQEEAQQRQLGVAEGAKVAGDVVREKMREGELLSPPATDSPIQLATQAGKRYIATYIAQSLALSFDNIIHSYTNLEDLNSER